MFNLRKNKRIGGVHRTCRYVFSFNYQFVDCILYVGICTLEYNIIYYVRTYLNTRSKTSSSSTIYMIIIVLYYIVVKKKKTKKKIIAKRRKTIIKHRMQKQDGRLKQKKKKHKNYILALNERVEGYIISASYII